MSQPERLQAAPREAYSVAQEKGVLDNVARALAGLRFGSVEIVVHEGKVTQIERKEKIRI